MTFPLVPLGLVLSSPIIDGPHSTPEFLSAGVPFLSVDGIQDGELDFSKSRYISEEDHAEFSKKSKRQKGDVLIGKAASTGKIALVRTDFEFNIWSPLAIIRSGDAVNSSYLAYALKAIPSQIQIDNLCSYNTQKNIAMSDIPRIRIPLPPLETQQRIADYLDRETAEIDAAVADLDRYVELLEKRRRVVISTGFGNPLFSPVKQRLKLLTVSEDHKRIPIKSEDRAKLTGEFPYYGASGIIDHVNGFLWDNATRLLVSEDGANLVARNHPIAFIASGRYWVNNHAHVLRCLDGVPPELVAMAIENTSIAHLITGSAPPKLTASAMWDIEFDFPATVKDRLALLECLSSELHEIDSLIAESKKLRELLLKRRSVLITEVVTGRKQV